MKYTNPIHLVDNSPWPMLISITLITIIINEKIIINIFLLFLIVFQWFRDILRENSKGEHTHIVQKGLTLGYFLFLISEIFLFFSLFWAYFHNSLSPSLDTIWPPLGIPIINPWGLPLLGSIILLSSGFFVTLAHHSFLLGNKSLSLYTFFITFFLGFLFLFLQYQEYFSSSFTLTDSIFGSIFYLTTGLHALHVLIGS